jgi:mutual gliding-motility protein MglA
MQTDFHRREVAIKLVYYGPPLSGKTTNLVKLHERLDARVRGRLLSLETQADRTLFFDLLPIVLRAGDGMTVKIKLYTVPGQVMHHVTRRLVLQGVDGVAFIADSRASETHNNNLSYSDLKANLRDNGIDPAVLPMVIQFNKRDLPGCRSDEEIDLVARRGREPVVKASALHGEGVVETLFRLMEETCAHLERTMKLTTRFGVDPNQIFDALGRQLQSAPSGERS